MHGVAKTVSHRKKKKKRIKSAKLTSPGDMFEAEKEVSRYKARVQRDDG